MCSAPIKQAWFDADRAVFRFRSEPLPGESYRVFLAARMATLKARDLAEKACHEAGIPGFANWTPPPADAYDLSYLDA